MAKESQGGGGGVVLLPADHTLAFAHGGEEVDDEDQKHIFSVTRRPRSDGSLSLPPSPNTRGPFLIIIDV